MTYAGVEAETGLAPARSSFAERRLALRPLGWIASWRRGQESNLHAREGPALAPRWLTVRRTSPWRKVGESNSQDGWRRLSRFERGGPAACPNLPWLPPESHRDGRLMRPLHFWLCEEAVDSGAPGGCRSHASPLPTGRTEPLSDGGLVGTAGVGPAPRSRQDRGLPLTYAPFWSGPADLHRAFPAPQAGGTLSSPGPDDPRRSFPVGSSRPGFWWAREESNPLVAATTGLRPASDPTRQRARKFGGPTGNCTPISGVRDRRSPLEL